MKKWRIWDDDNHINSCLSSLLRGIKILFIIQISLHFILPCFDAFLDLGGGFQSFIHTIYPQRYEDYDRFHHALYHGLQGNTTTTATTTTATTTTSTTATRNTICVPGAGFSGFWFSLGRINVIEQMSIESQSLGTITRNNRYTYTNTHTNVTNQTMHSDLYRHRQPNPNPNPNLVNSAHQMSRSPNNHSYTCFSAGCIGATVAIFNLTIESVLDIATETQGLWQRGTIGRYHIVEHFIDGILDLYLKNGFENGNANYLEEKLSRIRVLTTGRTKPEAAEACLGDGSCLDGNRRWYEYSYRYRYRYSHHLRSPTNMKELKELLMQTTWM